MRGQAKRDPALDCLRIEARLDAKAKAPSPLRSAGALQMVVLTRCASHFRKSQRMRVRSRLSSRQVTIGKWKLKVPFGLV